MYARVGGHMLEWRTYTLVFLCGHTLGLVDVHSSLLVQTYIRVGGHILLFFSTDIHRGTPGCMLINSTLYSKNMYADVHSKVLEVCYFLD